MLAIISTSLPSEELRWYINDFPPYSVLSGDRIGEGVVQKLISYLKTLIPEFNITPVMANVSRITEEFQKGHNILYGTYRQTPEREVYTLYTVPYLIYQSAGILVNKNFVHRWSKYLVGKSFDLKKAFTDREFRFNVIKDVTLGSWIDDPVANAPPELLQYVNLSSDSQNAERLMGLQMGRITAIPGYEESLRMNIKSLGLPLDEFQFYPVLGSPAYQKMSLAVTKNDWGRKLVEKLNPLLINLRPAVAKDYESWISKESIERYRLEKF